MFFALLSSKKKLTHLTVGRTDIPPCRSVKKSIVVTLLGRQEELSISPALSVYVFGYSSFVWLHSFLSTGLWRWSTSTAISVREPVGLVLQLPRWLPFIQSKNTLHDWSDIKHNLRYIVTNVTLSLLCQLMQPLVHPKPAVLLIIIQDVFIALFGEFYKSACVP